MNLDQNNTNPSRIFSCPLKTGLRAGELMTEIDPGLPDLCGEPFDPLDDGVIMRRCNNPDGKKYIVIPLKKKSK